ncbi:MAG: DNA-processing protein DprA [Solirubrobacteraceae bacterium]
MIDACAGCLRRTELIAWLAGRIEHEWRLRRGRPQLLALPDAELLRWAGEPDIARRYEAFGADLALDRLVAAGLGATCRCSVAYPAGLRELPDPPAVVHTAGDPALLVSDGVALVGARNPTPYGLEVVRALARGLGAAGVTVVSGMAMGIDSAAHAGALDQGRTVAVLATGADRPYPARAHGLHRRIAAAGCVVSELPPGFGPRRWAFPARNRLIAGLSAGTVVVEGGERSGSLITSDFAAELGRFVGGVPGPVTSRLSAGPHALLKAGAEVVRGAEDVLDLLHGAVAASGSARVVVGAGPRPLAPRPAPAPPPPDLAPGLGRLLEQVERGKGSLAELVRDPADGFAVSRDLGELELRGLVRRVAGGRYIRAVTAPSPG